MGLIAGLGESHMSQGNWALETTAEALMHPRSRGPQQEKPPQWKALTPQQEKARTQQQRPSAAKNN